MPHCHSLITDVTVTRHHLRRKKKQHHLCGPGRSCVAVCCCCRAPRSLASQPRQSFGSYLAAPPLTAQLFQEFLLPHLSIVLCFLAHSTQVPPCTTTVTRVQYCNFICHQSLIQQLPSHFHTSPPAPPNGSVWTHHIIHAYSFKVFMRKT